MVSPKQPVPMRVLETLVWALAWSLLALAVVGSLAPHEPGGLTFSDKMTHVVGYAALCSSFLLAAVWLPVRGPGRLPAGAVVVTVAVAAVGVVIEILQGFVGRNVDVLDVAANIIGCLWGLLLWSALRGALSERSL